MKRTLLVGTFIALGFASQEGAVRAESLEETLVQAPDTKNEKRNWHWAGRIFVLEELRRLKIADEIRWRNEMEISSARLGFKYKDKDFTAVMKVEFDGKTPDLKDAYLRLPFGGHVRLQAGRFKRPMSRIALESRWSLPSVDRGLLSSIQVQEQDLPFTGGRGDGVMLQARLPLVTSPVVQVAVFQSAVGELVSAKELGLDGYLRVEALPLHDVSIGVSIASLGYLAVLGDIESFTHGFMGSLDASVKTKYFRTWLETFLGRSTLPQTGTSTGGWLWAGRAFLAPRFGKARIRRLEPYVGISYLNPRLNTGNDGTGELFVGGNLSFRKRWRVQVEWAQVQNQGAASSGIEGMTLRAQLSARFQD